VLRRAVSSLWCAVLAVAAGCSSPGGGPPVERTGAITWTQCGRVQCGELSVPLDPGRPDGRRIALALVRRPASLPRVGVLLTNPGGPGASGVEFLASETSILDMDMMRRFDIVSWDPRGVGRSAPVECDDRLDDFYAVNRDVRTPHDVERNVAAARAFVASCTERSRELLEHVSTEDTVRDMDAIRAALGEERISYLGFSYGSYLGALYAERFPQHLRAAVLDGAVDPTATFEEAAVVQARGFERQLEAFFAWCARDERCGFARGADPRAAFDRLADAVAAEPTPATVDGQARTLGPGEFDIGVASALYGGEALYPALGAALAQTARGLGDMLLRFADAYTGRRSDGTYSNRTAALYAVNCVDGPVPRAPARYDAVARLAAAVAPHFGRTTAWLALPCAFWPARSPATLPAITAPAAPPLLVVGKTDDPATPYEWAQELAAQLATAELLTHEASGHTSYGQGDVCVNDVVDRYLESVLAPPGGARC
jgi:pimeloyl-ACP methyl ester carboxylesterase